MTYKGFQQFPREVQKMLFETAKQKAANRANG